MTGRHRSVFGGLWTDRIDAAAVLKGRIDVGLIAPHIAALVSNFLRAGFVIVKQAQQRGTASEPSAGLRHGESVAIGSVRGKTPEPGELVSSVLESKCLLDLLHPILEGPPLALSIDIVEGSDEGFRQPSSIEALPSPAECLALIVSVGDASVDLEVVRDSHRFPEFTPSGQSRWDSTSNATAIDVAVRNHGIIDRYIVEPDSVVIVGPGLIHRICTEAGTAALRVLCTPARHAPLDRMLAGSRKEIVLDSGARIWG